jgi:hypothetical protein
VALSVRQHDPPRVGLDYDGPSCPFHRDVRVGSILSKKSIFEQIICQRIESGSNLLQLENRSCSPGDDRGILSSLPQTVRPLIPGMRSALRMAQWRFVPANEVICIHIGKRQELCAQVGPSRHVRTSAQGRRMDGATGMITSSSSHKCRHTPI